MNNKTLRRLNWLNNIRYAHIKLNRDLWFNYAQTESMTIYDFEVINIVKYNNHIIYDYNDEHDYDCAFMVSLWVRRYSVLRCLIKDDAYAYVHHDNSIYSNHEYIITKIPDSHNISIGDKNVILMSLVDDFSK